MSYSLDSNGHLDLSPCLLRMRYDMFKVRDVSHEFYYAEMQNLVAWNGLPLRGMASEAKWLHLICKHNHDRGPLNPLTDIELSRVETLPIAKLAITGRLEVDVYQQTNRKKGIDNLEVVCSGLDTNYLVVLGKFADHYVLRSAYPAGSKYINDKVIPRSTLIERFRP